MGYLVAWTQEIDPDNHEGSTIDQYRVFVDGPMSADAKKAHAKYKELINMEEVTSASVCRIETSTEAHYVNFE